MYNCQVSTNFDFSILVLTFIIMDKLDITICDICLKQTHGDILLFKDKRKIPISNINLSYSICEDCEEMKKESFILIGIIQEKTIDKNKPYRSGNIWGIHKEDATKVFSHIPEILSIGVSYIDVHEANKLKLPDINFNA